MSWWRYRGQCTGRVLHFLYHYVGFDAAEHATIGNGVVDLHGKRLATFTWSDRFGENDVPEFVFSDSLLALRIVELQFSKREAAVVDALPTVPSLAARKPVDNPALLAVMPDAVRSLMLWAQLVRKTNAVDYFVARGADSAWVLWCKVGDGLLYWSRDLGAWLRGPKDEDVRA